MGTATSRAVEVSVPVVCAVGRPFVVCSVRECGVVGVGSRLASSASYDGGYVDARPMEPVAAGFSPSATAVRRSIQRAMVREHQTSAVVLVYQPAYGGRNRVSVRAGAGAVGGIAGVAASKAGAERAKVLGEGKRLAVW